MPHGGDRLGEAIAHARSIRVGIASEIREARLSAGLSQDAAASAVGLSGSQLGRIERGELSGLTIDQACRACAAVGLKFTGRAYPAGEAIRDAGQIALLARFRAELPSIIPWRTEVPIPVQGDLRAWDGLASFSGARVAVEAETRLRDVQALDRRVGLNQRDSGIELVILSVNDTPANRRIMRAAREALRSRFPLDGREILKAVRAGRTPGASGIMFL